MSSRFSQGELRCASEIHADSRGQAKGLGSACTLNRRERSLNPISLGLKAVLSLCSDMQCRSFSESTGILRQILGYGGIEGVAKAFNILLSLTLAAVLSVSDYGLIAILITFELVAAEVILLGQSTFILRFSRISELVRFEKNYAASRHIVLASTVIILIIVALLPAQIFPVQHSAEMRASLLALILGIGLQAHVTIYLMYLRSVERIKHYGFLRVGGQGLKFLISFSFVLFFRNPFLYPLGILFSALIISLSILCWQTESWKPPRLAHAQIEYSAIAENLKFGFPIAVHSFAGVFYAILDRIFLARIADMRTVAVYNFALTQGTAIFFLMNILAIALIPKFYQTDSYSESSRRYLNFFLLSSISGTALLSVIVYYVVFPISLRFVPDEYRVGQNILPLLAAGMIGQCASNYAVYKLTALKAVNLLPFFTLLSLGANAFLNFLLIPKFGINGAACALLFGEISYAIMLNLHAIRCQRSSGG